MISDNRKQFYLWLLYIYKLSFFPRRKWWKKWRVGGRVQFWGSPVHWCGLRSLHLSGSRYRGAGVVGTPPASQALGSVFGPAGSAPHPQTQQQQQRLRAQRHPLPTASFRQLLLSPLREGERGLRPPSLHRPGNGATEPCECLLQSLN